MAEQLARLPALLGAHLELALLALLAGALLSIPLGVWIHRRPALEHAVLGAASVIQTVPSLALLAFMVPALAWLGGVTVERLGFEIASIGFPPAFIALTLYSVLPMLRNTVTGLAGVDAALIEAARGVGMTPRQQLLRVELPLAAPTVIAGVRTAAVWVVGTATLSTPVGASSLGDFIFGGLQTRNLAAVVVGCTAAALLALLLDGLVGLVERGLRRRSRLVLWAGAGGLLALYLATGASLVGGAGAGAVRPVVIGAKPFTEQYILSEILAGQIRRRTGLPVRTLQSLGSTVIFDALRAGEIDTSVDYTGTLWATVMQRTGAGPDRATVLAEVERFLAGEGIRLVGPLGFENTYALAMREGRARELGVRTIGDLAEVAEGLEVGADYEILGRPEWAALARGYGLAFHRQRTMDPSLMYEAVAHGQVDVITAYSTDGRVAAYGLVLLEDDRGVIPPYDAVLLVGTRLERKHPEAVAALGELVGSLDDSQMQRLNLAVDRDGRSPADVAGQLLAGLRRPGG